MRTVGHGGHVVIALPGWYGSSGWAWLPELVDQDAFTYVFVDYRGYGARRGEAGEHTVDEIASDVLATADQMGVETFSLMGHSMGGKAAQRVLVAAPERVRRLVGIAPVPASPVSFSESGFALYAGAAHDPAKRAQIVDALSGHRLTRTWIDAVVAESMTESDPEAFEMLFYSWAGADFSDRVAGLATPVLVVVGEHDPGMSAEVMADTWLAWYPNAELEIMTNAGHYPMAETPIALVTVVERFLARDQGPAPSPPPLR